MLYNLIAPVGWRVGELRVEDVAIGVAVSAVVGVFFWPRGVTAVVAEDLADAFHSGGIYLVQATAWALGIRRERPDGAARAVAAGNRLDDALRGLLSEQGTKRVRKEDVWLLESAALRVRLVAYALAREVSPERSRGEGPRTVMAESVRLAGEYDALAARLGHTPDTVAEELAGLDLGTSVHSAEDGQLVWIELHLDHLANNLEEIAQPARSLAERVDRGGAEPPSPQSRWRPPGHGRAGRGRDREGPHAPRSGHVRHVQTNYQRLESTRLFESAQVDSCVRAARTMRSPRSAADR